MAFNEDSRVKIPAILDLIHFEFAYLPYDKQVINRSTLFRDWLLPMMMNGQVTVADEEEHVDEELGLVAEEGGM